MNAEIIKNIGRLQNFVDPWSDGYKFVAFSYVALKQPGKDTPVVLAAAIRLLPPLDQSKTEPFTCETSSILAGFTISPMNMPLAELFSSLTEGIITPNGRRLRISDQGLTSQFDTGANALKTNQPRAATLKILAVGLNAFLQDSNQLEEIDCELRSSTTPFDGVSDLLAAVGLDANLGRENSELSVVATNLIAVDRVESVISRGTARIHCLSTPNLKKDRLRIGIMPFTRKYSERKSIPGTVLSWEIQEDGIAHGSTEINVGDSPAVQLFLSHSNTLFDRWWIFDPEKHINPAYAVHQAIDAETTALKNFLSGQSKDPANDLERGVTLLLSLFRFSVAHYGLIPTLRDGPDLLAFTPSNELLVIDCTTGLPNENNKVSKLISRTERIRLSLHSAGHPNVEVLPVIVTTSPRGTIQRDIAEAASHGVVVAAKEQIDSLIERVRIPPSPAQIFAEAKALLTVP